MLRSETMDVALLEAPFLVKEDDNFLTKVTPYKAAVFLLADEAREHDCSDSRWRSSLAILFHSLISTDHMDLEELMEKVEELEADALSGAFVERLRASLAGGDGPSLNLDRILAEPTAPLVSPRSLLGLFLRRLALSASRLSFTEHLAFVRRWEDFLRPIAETPSEAPRRPDGEHQLARSEALDFVRLQLDALLGGSDAAAENPDRLDRTCSLILTRFPDLYQAQFLCLANRLRQRDLVGAREALQHYLDTVSLAFLYAHRGEEPSPAHMSKAFRFGPLLLAKLFRGFGFEAEAGSLIRECVNHTQASDDRSSLRQLLFERLQAPASADDDLDHVGRIHAAVRKLSVAARRPDEVLRARLLGARRLLALGCAVPTLLSALDVATETATSNSPGAASATPAQRRALLRLRGSERSFLGALAVAQGNWELGTAQAELGGGPEGIGTAALVLGAREAAYPAALRLLDEAEQGGGLVSALLKFDRAFYAGRWETSAAILPSLAPLSDTEFRFRTAMYESAQGNTEDAIAQLSTVAETSTGPEAWYNRCRALLSSAEIFVPSNPARASAALDTATQIATEMGFGGLSFACSVQAARLSESAPLDLSAASAAPLGEVLKARLVEARRRLRSEDWAGFRTSLEAVKEAAVRLGSLAVAADAAELAAAQANVAGRDDDRNAQAEEALHYRRLAKGTGPWIDLAAWLS